MTNPRVILVGAPNTGKSTLFNRLVGRRKALIHREPGMTRDSNEELHDWNGRPVTLVDTGGLLPPGETPFAGIVRQRVLDEARRADVMLFLVDGRRGVTPIDLELAKMFRETNRPIILLINKIDVPGRDEMVMADFHRLGFETMVGISAEHGLGITELVDVVEGLLPPLPETSPESTTPDTSESAGTTREKRAIRLAICGRPNVGKSSLLNRLLGADRALVSEVPGTTRDSIDCLLTVGGHLYRIIDTAGIRRKGKVSETPEVLSVMTAQRNIENADVVLLLMDATESPTLQDLHVAGIARESLRPFVVLLNKWDIVGDQRSSRGGSVDPLELVERVKGRLKFAPWAPVLTISALTGWRTERILSTVDEVHAQAGIRLSTGKLNTWLRRAVTAHRPPAAGGRELKLFYAAQKGANPPSFVIFTSSPKPPHFSYQRYLDNSLREHFGLTRTPVGIEYRQRPRDARPSVAFKSNRRRRPV